MLNRKSYTSHETGPESAMTEVALALAMGIFSIMVLTMISMGIGPAKPGAKTENEPVQNIEALVVSGSAGAGKGASNLKQTDLIVIFHQGQFFNQQLKAITAQSVSQKANSENQRIVLAIDPSAPLEKVLKARGSFSSNNLIVTQLDQDWINRLADGVRQ